MTSYKNVGNLFPEDKLLELHTYPEWSSEPLETSRRLIEELYEKRDEHLKEDMDSKNTSYYWTSYVLRRLGFCCSVAELPPNEGDARPDATLFVHADDFRRARDYRGSREFFSHAVGVVRAFGWNDSLDEMEVDGQSYTPAFDIDRHLRNTGVEWGILTNGQVWRLYHRDSSGTLDTYFEVNLTELLEQSNKEGFNYFWMLFSTDAMGRHGQNDAITSRLLI